MMESTQAKRVKLTMLNFNYIKVIIINMNMLLTDISSTSYYGFQFQLLGKNISSIRSN